MGEARNGEFKRYGKGYKEIWTNASYNPVLSVDGKPYKIVKFATDTTRNKINNLEKKWKDCSTKSRASYN